MLLLPVFHLHWQWHGFSLKQKKTNLIRTFFLLNILLNIFMFSYYSPTVWRMFVLFQCLECKLPKGVKHDLYLTFILFRQNGPMIWREAYAALKTLAEFIKLKALRKICWMYFSFKLDFFSNRWVFCICPYPYKFMKLFMPYERILFSKWPYYFLKLVLKRWF